MAATFWSHWNISEKNFAVTLIFLDNINPLSSIFHRWIDSKFAFFWQNPFCSSFLLFHFHAVKLLQRFFSILNCHHFSSDQFYRNRSFLGQGLHELTFTTIVVVFTPFTKSEWTKVSTGPEVKITTPGAKEHTSTPAQRCLTPGSRFEALGLATESQDGAAAAVGRLLRDDDVLDVGRFRRHDDASLDLRNNYSQ